MLLGNPGNRSRGNYRNGSRIPKASRSSTPRLFQHSAYIRGTWQPDSLMELSQKVSTGDTSESEKPAHK